MAARDDEERTPPWQSQYNKNVGFEDNRKLNIHVPCRSRRVLTSSSTTLLTLFLLASSFVATTQGLQFLGARETYAKFPKWDACINASISFEFKTRLKDGLLMYTDDNGRYDYLQVAITEGAVRLWINFVQEKEQIVEIELGRNLNDGKWHRVEVKRNRMETTLLVDSNQSSKVAFGSDYYFGDELETNNYLYFGGVPNNYTSNLATLNLPAAVYESRFRGEIRNILYFNCSCMPVRGQPLEERGTRDYPKEACDVRNPCTNDCPCISGDDGPGCACNYRQECVKDLLAYYRLPMDRIERDLIQNPSGLDSRVYGSPRLVRGVRDKAIHIRGSHQWVRVSGPSHKRECFGNLDHCPKGYYLGMWIKFDSGTDKQAIYMSNGGHRSDGHGVVMRYGPNGIEFTFKKKDGKEWTVQHKHILPSTWYHVAASWKEDGGLHLYINGKEVAKDATPRQTNPVRDDGQFRDFVIGRSNDGEGKNKLVPIMVDDFTFTSTFKDKASVVESGPAFHRHIYMDNLKGNKLDMVGGEAKLVGQGQLIPGKIGNAISLSGNGEYVDLGEATEQCLGDLDACQNGFYISFFVKFPRLDNDRNYLFSSPRGMDIYQQGSVLMASARRARKSWEVRYNALTAGEWYFVEVSWTQEEGLSLYVNQQEVDKQTRESFLRDASQPQSQHVYMGRSNDNRRRRTASAVIDDVDIFYAGRKMLNSINYIQTAKPDKYHFGFEEINNQKLVHEGMQIVLMGDPKQVSGKVGKALKLDGTNDYVDFGDHGSTCFGNLNLCSHGTTFAMWLRPDRLRNNMHFLSSGNNGVTLKYRNGKLHATAQTSFEKWDASTSNIQTDKWYFVEISFNPMRGLMLYLDNQLVAEDKKSSPRTTAPKSFGRVYLGHSNDDKNPGRLGQATFDEMNVWFADRDYLSSHGIIQRSKPRHFLIPFEEKIGDDRLSHPVLSIRLVGRPNLIPGKVSNALQLRGRGQYADLGRRGNECMSKLSSCTQGITIASWMRFNGFENQMVFLSTGENGILMMFYGGYIQVSASGRGVISVPKFELNRWYFIEITWHPETGLKFYVDNKLVGESDPALLDPGSNRGSFYIGHPNSGDIPSGRYSTGNFDVDEMEIWYGKREDLLAFGHINRDNLGFEEFTFNQAVRDKLPHPNYDVFLVNGPRIVSGRYDNAVSLDGRGQYVDFGQHFDKCFGNLDFCTHGMTFSIWIDPKDLRDGTTFFTAPTYNLYYDNGMLKSDFKGERTTWTTSSPRLRANSWQRVTMSWHPRKGLKMYIDDELVNSDVTGRSVRRGQPRSRNIYVGRNYRSDRNTARMLADELQVWYDDLDQLRATKVYRVQVVPHRITFENFRDNRLKLRDREIRGYGDIRLQQGRGKDTRAVYLPGTNSYLDLGSNFTCGGDLETCRQGATIRIGLRPTTLRNGMYFLDSWPVKLYYEDGRLKGRLQTSTQVWNVETGNFQANKWQRIELTWHPREGLVMYIDGQKVDSQTHPIAQPSRVVPKDWRTYFGRALEGGRTYANLAVDNIEYWQAYRDLIPNDRDYLNIPIYTPPPPTQRPRPLRPTTPRPGNSASNEE